ncbi:MAG: (2Fe-2S) ferredoxin domain-containing protein [Cyanobacteriota bacterium]|nr:(2Fe-2S) ferredoxin domain-containing protein [Cyanobacteriota bacterium]
MSCQQILVCQNRTCRKQGAKAVLAAFQKENRSEIEIVSSGCLGQCENGPMVVVLPEKIWRDRISVEEVPGLLKQIHSRSCQ